MKSFKRIALAIIASAAGTLLTVSMASAAANRPAVQIKRVNYHSTAQSRISRQVHHMSWRQKVGQMIVGDGFPNSPREDGYIAHHYNLGGMILESSNMNGNVKRMTNRMQRSTHHSLLIGTDEEGGEVSRLGYNPRKFPSPQEAYRQGGMRRVHSAYSYMGWRLHRLGINWDYAPDADVATPGSYMYFRAFGHGAKMTAKYISYAVPAIQRNHVAATLKHFPGYGSEHADTDYSTVHSNRSLHHLEHVDFLPFRAGIRKGADSIMVTNIILNKVQRKVPATLSRRDINLLRHKLHFNGVVVTDSLDARSIRNYSQSHNVFADLAALRAGNDMVMTQDFRSAIPRLTRDVKDGKLPKKQVNASVTRILTMKHKLGLNY